MELVASSSPSSVGYISHLHRAYDYSGPFRFFFGYIWIDTKIVFIKAVTYNLIDKQSNVNNDEQTNKPHLRSMQVWMLVVPESVSPENTEKHPCTVAHSIHAQLFYADDPA